MQFSLRHDLAEQGKIVEDFLDLRVLGSGGQFWELSAGSTLPHAL